ncbi:MAG: DUF2796 domain-containing protein [Proteobacteria bacterium]|nr:DUF2796 domain-containing protein [Pseudomonadota bacterium]MDA0928721.1 DUF2796 domain-containing protein [Pseudomonadota bacterium]
MTFTRSKARAIWLLALLAAAGVVRAQGLDSHVHGSAELNVVSIGQQLQIEFFSPAINLLGFETAPNNEEETAMLNETSTQLQDDDWLLGDALPDCQLTTNTIETPAAEEHIHEQDDDHDHSGHAGDVEAHSNFHVQYLYDCPAAPPDRLLIVAFDRYKGIESITVQWIAGQKQGFAKLTPSNPVLTFD